MRRLRPIVIVAALAGCAGGPGAADGAAPAACFVGDPGSDPEVVLVHRTSDGQLATVAEGAPIPLFEPPQGGQVILVGVRVRNIDGCPLTISTSLAIPQTSIVAAFERRPVTLETTPDGWLQPKRPDLLSNFANLPSCPIAGLDRPIDGETYQLTVEAEDHAGRKGRASAIVVPSCDMNVAPALCRCLCAANYVLGSVCS